MNPQYPASRPSTPSYSPQFPTMGATEWQEPRPHSPAYPLGQTFRSYTPRSFSRPHSPPSISPSPSPSVQSHYPDSNTIEIEELSEDDAADSGIELLVGEYEEAPENYRQHQNDEEDEDWENQQSVLYGLERLTANQTPSPISRAMVQRIREGGQYSVQSPRTKRSYADSVGSDSDYDSGRDSTSSCGGRIRRRRLSKRREIESKPVSTRTTPDFHMEM